MQAKGQTIATHFENRDFAKRDAIDMIKQVERFYQWVISQI